MKQAKSDKKQGLNNSSSSSGFRSVPSGQAKTMAELMAKQTAKVSSFEKGQVVKGKIIKLTSKETLVDIGSKALALAIEKERPLQRLMQATLKEGQEVDVVIINPESELGFPLVTLRRFLDNIVWKNLEDLQKEKTKIQVSVDSKIAGGYLVSGGEGISGFLPNSQVSFSEGQPDLTGQKMEVVLWEINRVAHKIVFSQKAIFGSEDFDKSVQSLKIGQKINATVSNITTFGIFVSIPVGEEKYLDGLIHISEISWEKVEKVEGLFELGDLVEAVIIDFDNKSKRVNLSLKRLTEDPFEKVMEKYKVEQKVKGLVSRVNSSGVVVDLEDSVEGFIRKEKIPPTVKYAEGQEITATILSIDKKKHRVELTPVLLDKPIGYK